MIDKKTRAMIDTFRLFSSKNSKVSEPRVLKHIAQSLWKSPTMKKYNVTINTNANQTWYLSLQYYKLSCIYCNLLINTNA